MMMKFTKVIIHLNIITMHKHKIIKKEKLFKFKLKTFALINIEIKRKTLL